MEVTVKQPEPIQAAATEEAPALDIATLPGREVYAGLPFAARKLAMNRRRRAWNDSRSITQIGSGSHITLYRSVGTAVRA